jgi:aminopeptidase YwaD
VLALALAATIALPPGGAREAKALATRLAHAGPRPAAGARERSAHELMARRFAAAGLELRRVRFTVPGRGRSRDVIGVWHPGRRCLRVVMAHADTVPPSPGADDNGSGLGLLAALAPRLDAIGSACTVWLVATGAEERIYTGSPDHLGSRALVQVVPRRRLRYALSLDEVGRGTRFELRSPSAAVRPRVEAELLRAARTERVRLGWSRDDSTGNSDHREFELAGLPGVKLGVPDEPVRHTAADTADRLRRSAFGRVLRVVARTLRG